MARGGPELLAQLSDPHVQVGRGDRGPAEALARAVRAVLALDPGPRAVLVSGDLVDAPGAREYERVRELLAPLPMPVFVVAGNHDDRDALRELFVPDGSAGGAGEPFRYSARVDGVRLVACDTTRRGFDDGELSAEHRFWLEQQLVMDPATPTILALHHPPIEIGIRPLDELGLPEPARIALGDILALHPQVRRVVAGHVHRGAFGVLGGCGVMTCPSTYLQAPLEIPGGELRLVPEPPAFAVHAALGDDVVSHLQPIEG